MTTAASVSGYLSCAKSRGRMVVMSRCVPKGERHASACVCRATDEPCSPRVAHLALNQQRPKHPLHGLRASTAFLSNASSDPSTP